MERQITTDNNYKLQDKSFYLSSGKRSFLVDLCERQAFEAPVFSLGHRWLSRRSNHLNTTQTIIIIKRATGVRMETLPAGSLSNWIKSIV